MNKLKFIGEIKKTVAAVLLVLAVYPIEANAEWKKDYNGWWNTEGSSWSVGWKEIDGKWYYFYSNGYMAHDITINGYTLGSDGALIKTVENRSSYKELNKLSKKYNSKIAEQNGDVVQVFGEIVQNKDKLDRFIENYKNKKSNIGDMVRITQYGDEGDATINDLIIDSDGSIKLVDDNTRDEYSSDRDRIITEYKGIDVYKIENETSKIVMYYAKINNGEEIFLGTSDL